MYVHGTGQPQLLLTVQQLSYGQSAIIDKTFWQEENEKKILSILSVLAVKATESFLPFKLI